MNEMEMTFTDLCRHVEGSFIPRRYTSVHVDRTVHTDGEVVVEFTVHVGGAGHDGPDNVVGYSIKEVKAAFDARWLTERNPDAETAKVDA